MIINIPLQIDDAALEGKLKEDYENKVAEKVSEMVINALADKGDSWRFNNKEQQAKYGIIHLVNLRIDSYFDEHKDEIYEAVTKKLWDRSRNRKVLKDAANEAVEGGLKG